MDIINLNAIRVQRGGQPYRDPRTLVTPAGPARIGSACVVHGHGVGTLVAITGNVGTVCVRGEDLMAWGRDITPIFRGMA